MTREERQRILIVEDDPEMLYLLSVILDGDDREVVAVQSGSEAEEALERGPFDLIALDLILPDLDGRTLLTRLRGRPATATVPVVVISARADPGIRQECHALGADAFIDKPFDPDEVERDVAVRLERGADRDREGLTDPLTGLLNRAGLAGECDGASGDYGVALVQIDGFMTVAESWGWESAEEVVREVGKAILAAAADEARVGRLGGGEFVLCASDEVDAARVAQRVLDNVRELRIADPEGGTARLTVSIGVLGADAGTELDEALADARRRLFRAREAGRNQVVSSEADIGAAKIRVLVAEDDEISATILLHRLEKEGLEIKRFDNGRAAYEAALEETPDLVILDIKMPGMDGFEVLERLRRTPAYQAIPIILLTSMGSEADVVRGFELGADDYILKPFSPIELSARVWRLLRRGRSASAI